MSVVRKASSSSTVIKKKSSSTKLVESKRPITAFDELNDVDASSPQDGQVLIYDSAVDKFRLVETDVLLSQSVEDNDLPDEFITQLESELNIGQISVDALDGGSF